MVSCFVHTQKGGCLLFILLLYTKKFANDMIKSKFSSDSKSFASPNIEIFHENLSLFKNLLFSPIALIYDSLSLSLHVYVCVHACVCVRACLHARSCCMH